MTDALNSVKLLSIILPPFLTSFVIYLNNGVDINLASNFTLTQAISLLLILFSMVLLTYSKNVYVGNYDRNADTRLLMVITLIALLSSIYNQDKLPVIGIIQTFLLIYTLKNNNMSRDELLAKTDQFFSTICYMIIIAFLLNIISSGAYFSNIEPSRYQTLNIIPNMQYRWGSIFGYANLSGYFGVIMVVYGIGRRSPSMKLVSFVGSITIVLAESIGSLVAIVLIIIVAIIFGDSKRIRRICFFSLIPIVYLVYYILASDYFSANIEVGNGRILIWLEYLSLISSLNQFLFGIGGSGIEAAIGEGFLEPQASNAHLLFLDGFVRYGFIFLIFELLFFGTMVSYALKNIRSKYNFIIYITLVFLVSTFSEALINWLDFSPLYVIMSLLLFMNFTGNKLPSNAFITCGDHGSIELCNDLSEGSGVK